MKEHHIQHKQSLNVPFEYSVHFSRDVFSANSTAVTEAISEVEPDKEHRILFVIESELLKHSPNLINDINSYCQTHTQLIKQSSQPLLLDGGEQLKSFSVVENICKVIDDNKLCRHSFIGIIGGGAFLDAVGFAASIVHRGIRQLRFPTTVLAQCDSGVGVKNGINMFGKKNFVGCFAPPFAVINDFNFLDTLNPRDWRSGISEAIKVSIIKDSVFFDWLCNHGSLLAKRDQESMEYLVEKSATIHSDHITGNGDPFEFGSARPLDFGHWAAHKLEMMTQNKLRHGEAVAIGILIDSFYAMKKDFISKTDFDRIERLFVELGFTLWEDYLHSRDSNGILKVITGLIEFQEHLGGELHITLPDGIGAKFEVNEMDHQLVADAIDYLYENHG